MNFKFKKTKSGFTLVELVVVIAVIAILSAAAIGAYFGITKKARISSDQQIVDQINSALLQKERLNNDQKCATMNDAVAVAKEAGFLVEKLTPTYDGYDMVWDQEANRFALLEKGSNGSYTLVYGDNNLPQGRTYSAPATDLYKFWNVYSPEKTIALKDSFSIYLADGDYAATKFMNDATTEAVHSEGLTINVGFDAGENTTGVPSKISYVNASNKAQEVVIRTNSFETLLVVSAPKDTVNHYGFAYIADVQSINNASYHEHGTVGRLKVARGHAVVESTGTVFCAMDKDGEATGAIIDVVGKVYTETSTGENNVNAGVTQQESGVFNDEYKDCGYGHHNMQKLVVDEKHVYEVCTACGYTVMVAGDNEGTPVYHTSANQEATVSDPVVTVDETTKEVTVTNTESAKPIVFGDVQEGTDIEKVASCEHTFGEMVEVVPATTETTGVGKYTCTKCGFSYTVTIPKKKAADTPYLFTTVRQNGELLNEQFVAGHTITQGEAQNTFINSQNKGINNPKLFGISESGVDQTFTINYAGIYNYDKVKDYLNEKIDFTQTGTLTVSLKVFADKEISAVYYFMYDAGGIKGWSPIGNLELKNLNGLELCKFNYRYSNGSITTLQKAQANSSFEQKEYFGKEMAFYFGADCDTDIKLTFKIIAEYGEQSCDLGSYSITYTPHTYSGQ